MNDTAEARVTLSVLSGPSQGSEFTFDERATCVLGRAVDCRPRLPRDDMRVSRHHCLIDINPPDVRVRDFGGPHGTFVNGEEVGSRPSGPAPGPGTVGARLPERDLADGDEVRLGATVLRIGIRPAGRTPVLPYCAHCDRQLSATAPGRAGDMICSACRAQPLLLLQGLLARAERDEGLAGLRGYEVVRELSRGRPAMVYLARHRGTGEPAALQVLLAEVAVGTGARADFLRATERVRGLRHGNIAGCRAAGADGAAFWLICEYCPGGTLRELLAQRGGTLPPDEAVGLAVQILDGLAHAHRLRQPPSGATPVHPSARHPPHPLVHGAIRPSNILLTDAAAGRRQGTAGAAPGTVKIAGFGLAQAFDRTGLSGLTRTGPLAGTVAYQPRTQVTGHTCPEDDVWATAATLYRMLTGATPRDFPPAADPLAVLLKEPAVPVRKRHAVVPRRLAQVIDAALIDSPRIVTTRADEFKTALLEAVR